MVAVPFREDVAAFRIAQDVPRLVRLSGIDARGKNQALCQNFEPQLWKCVEQACVAQKPSTSTFDQQSIERG